MKKMLFIALVAALWCTALVAESQEKKSVSAISDWLKGLQNRIAQIAPKKTVSLTNSVAGVRGANEDMQAKLYWKGKENDAAVTENELSQFKAAIDLAEKGDEAGAIRDIEAFMKEYPDSALIPDAKKTLDLVKVDIKPQGHADK